MWAQKAADSDFEIDTFRGLWRAYISPNGTPEEVWRLKLGFAQWRLEQEEEEEEEQEGEEPTDGLLHFLCTKGMCES